MIANLDDNIARLEALLQETGLRDNTILIFMNDNGGTAGVKVHNAGMRGRKTEYYDGGHRAACFLRWPAGKLRSPGDIDTLTEIQDLLPTLIDLCGLRQVPRSPLPSSSLGRRGGAAFDGVCLTGLLRGTQDNRPGRMLVVQYGQRPVKWDAAVMWNKWRLVKGEELYDLKTDPGQMKNVASQHADVFQKMRDHYDKYWAAVEPTVDDFSPISIGSEHENPATLSAADWANVYCDNMNNLRAGLNRNGPWHVRIERDGSYEIELRRWPKEADAPIAGGVPERALRMLRAHKDEPFFLAFGLAKPHSPPTAPKKCFDMYDPADMPLPPDFAATPTVPPGFPKPCVTRNGDLFIKRAATEQEARAMVRAYYASISWVDWNVGRVLTELKKLGLEDKTIVVFWGDHGYHLGEKGKWSKHGSLFEVGTRVPFLIAAPEARGNGKASPRVVQALDFYPTLVDLCGLPQPKGLEGHSLKPLLDGPQAKWDHPAFSIFGLNPGKPVGVAVRTERYRYVDYGAAGAMLFDHTKDPHEMHNLADDPKFATVRAGLSALTKQHVAAGK